MSLVSSDLQPLHALSSASPPCAIPFLIALVQNNATKQITSLIQLIIQSYQNKNKMLSLDSDCLKAWIV